MRNLKSNKGITIIALIVTIIVLLILAGVTINLMSGDKGIIMQAKQAEARQKETRIEEAINAYKVEREIAKYTSDPPRTPKQVAEALEEEGTITEEEIDDIETRIKGELNI